MYVCIYIYIFIIRTRVFRRKETRKIVTKILPIISVSPLAFVAEDAVKFRFYSPRTHSVG